MIFCDDDGRKAQALPPAFSYSPLVIPLSSSGCRTVTLLRRDLFDARYQLISESASSNDPSGTSTVSSSQKALEGESEFGGEDALKFIDNPSDLVPDMYEGGLKTWECSLDLVDCLAGFVSVEGDRGGKSLGQESRDGGIWVRGKRIIEVRALSDMWG